jgi:hypothetical protein
MNWKGFERKQGTFLVFVWKYSGKSRKLELGVADMPTQLRGKHLQNTSQECRLFTKLLHFSISSQRPEFVKRLGKGINKPFVLFFCYEGYEAQSCCYEQRIHLKGGLCILGF